MSPFEMREALKRIPVFGDVQQIKALKALRVEEESREGLTEYRVTIEWSGSETVTVWAEDESDAKEEAFAKVNVGDCDECDYTVVQVSL